MLCSPKLKQWADIFHYALAEGFEEEARFSNQVQEDLISQHLYQPSQS